MSKLQSAKSAIEAEIAFAKQGLAFYQSRIDVLEHTLFQLDSVMEIESVPEANDIKPRKRQTLTTQKRGRGQRVRQVRKEESGHSQELPSTAGDYWLNLITDEPRSAVDILDAAINTLGFTPDETQVRKLRQRMTAALQGLLQVKKIQDSGARRERRFFKA